MKNIIQEYWGTKTKDEVKFQQSPFPIDTSFEQTLFVATPLIVSELKQIDKSHGGSPNHWVGGLMHITVQTRYDLQYLAMSISGYMNAPTEPSFLALKNDMEYITDHKHEPIMYSRNKIHITEEIPHQFYFKSGDAEIRKTKECSNFLHTYCDVDHERGVSDRRTVTFTVHLFNGTIIYWCAKKKSETSRSSSNAETRAMYTGVLYQNCIRYLFR